MPPNKSIFNGRISTLKKKANELSILCDVPVTLICYEPNGILHTWPDNVDECREIVTLFKQNIQREKRFDIGGLMATKKRNSSNGYDKLIIGLEDKLQKSVGTTTEKEELMGIQAFLGNKLKEIEQRKRVLEEKKNVKGLKKRKRDIDHNHDCLITDSAIAISYPDDDASGNCETEVIANSDHEFVSFLEEMIEKQVGDEEIVGVEGFLENKVDDIEEGSRLLKKKKLCDQVVNDIDHTQKQLITVNPNQQFDSTMATTCDVYNNKMQLTNRVDVNFREQTNLFDSCNSEERMLSENNSSLTDLLEDSCNYGTVLGLPVDLSTNSYGSGMVLGFPADYYAHLESSRSWFSGLD
ncbi:hypothetical protein ACFE04_008042 [Oxalis oulophora]